MRDGLTRRVDGGLSRRTLLKAAAAVGVTAAIFAGSGPFYRAGAAFAQAQPFPDDVAVLNYMLTIEHLTADLYARITSAENVVKSPHYWRYLNAFKDHEDVHVRVLSKIIGEQGGRPVEPRPTYNFSSFELGTERQATLLLAGIEEVGLGAYQGAASFIKEKWILTFALRILGVEAEHTGALHSLIGLKPTGESLTEEFGISTKVLNGAFTRPISDGDVYKAIEPILAG